MQNSRTKFLRFSRTAMWLVSRIFDGMDKHTKEYLQTLDTFEKFLETYFTQNPGKDSYTQIASAFKKQSQSGIRARPMLNELVRKFVIYKENPDNYGFIKRYHTSHYKEARWEGFKKGKEKLLLLIVGAIISFLSANIPKWMEPKQETPLKIHIEHPKVLIAHDIDTVYLSKENDTIPPSHRCKVP